MPFIAVPYDAAKLQSMPQIVDLYHDDDVDSFATAKQAGLVAVIHKASTGASGKDPLYSARRRDAEAAGLLWGAYHWGTAAPIDEQVQNFLDAAKPAANTLVALDFETTVGDQMTLEGARAFCQAILDRLGRRAVLYSGEVAKSALGNASDPFFAAHRLWLAQYGDAPTVQSTWTTFWLWQYTDGKPNTPGAKTVPGIRGNVRGYIDCNYFGGSPEDLAGQWAN